MPVIAILLAMARILSALLFAIGDHDDRRGGRVWIPCSKWWAAAMKLITTSCQTARGLDPTQSL